MSIEDKLRAWENSPAGKARILAALKDKKHPHAELGKSTHQVNYYADQMVNILRSYIESAGFEFGNYLNWVNVGWDAKNQTYEVHVNFDPASISRPSLAPETYPEGAYDIVALMNHGYSANGRVAGYWGGEYIFSRQKREGARFMENAVAEFNSRFAGKARARLGGKYK